IWLRASWKRAAQTSPPPTSARSSARSSGGRGRPRGGSARSGSRSSVASPRTRSFARRSPRRRRRRSRSAPTTRRGPPRRRATWSPRASPCGWMPMRWRDAASLVALAAIAVAAVLVAPAGGGGAASPRQPGDAAGWSGLVGAARAPVATGQRVLVVLSAFSLADRVTRAGGRASDADERRWTAAALAAQGQFSSNLGAQGVSIRPEFRFTRTLNGFSATLDARAIAALERLPGVKGVYPVRVAYPAATGSTDRGGSSAAVRLAGIAGRGVTIALLDTGVDLHKASFRGHVLGGIDVLGGALDARAKAKPTDPAQLEAHGTEM